MTRSPQTLNQYRDLVHAAALLILVPIVFYGGYRLVSSSTETEPAHENVFQQGIDFGKRSTEKLLETYDLSPGEVWIAEVDRLKQSLSNINSADSRTMRRRDLLEDQLDAIGQHCETHKDTVPEEIAEQSLLGRMLIRFASEIDLLRNQPPQTAATLDWETEFKASESNRLSQQAMSINDEWENRAVPLRREHTAKLASVSRQNRELADALQRTLDRIQKIEWGTCEQIARHQRSEAYARDKDEIARLLKPFTSPGYFQLRSTPEDWVKQADAKPLSYRTLDRIGALSTDINGVRALARIGGLAVSYHSTSARPLGAFPVHHTWSDPRNIESIKRAQQLLKEHSVYLIETGLLQP